MKSLVKRYSFSLSGETKQNNLSEKLVFVHRIPPAQYNNNSFSIIVQRQETKCVCRTKQKEDRQGEIIL